MDYIHEQILTGIAQTVEKTADKVAQKCLDNIHFKIRVRIPHMKSKAEQKAYNALLRYLEIEMKELN